MSKHTELIEWLRGVDTPVCRAALNEIERLRAGLEEYANEENWLEYPDAGEIHWRHQTKPWEKARKVLANEEEK